MTSVPARPGSDPAVPSGSARTRRRGWCGSAIGNAIAHAANRIVVGSDWRNSMQELLDQLGQAMGVSRVTLFETHPGPQRRLVESCRYDWAGPGVARLSTDPRCQNMALVDEQGELDEWTRRRQRGKLVMATLRQVAGYDRQVFLEQGVLSFVSAPIMLRRGYWGFLGFDDCKAERTWSRHEIAVLGTAGGLIAGAMERPRRTRGCGRARNATRWPRAAPMMASGIGISSPIVSISRRASTRSSAWRTAPSARRWPLC